MEKKGYEFVGWYIDPECKKRINPGGRLPTVTQLYAKWLPVLYPIRYKMNGGMNSRKNARYISIESPEIPLFPAKKLNMIFDGWYMNGEEIVNIPAKQSEPIEIEAKFVEPPFVAFETNGGAKIKQKQVNTNRLLKKFNPPLRTGYAFGGWYWDEKCIFPFDFNQEIKESCTLYAKWEMEKYSITYDAQGGIPSRRNPSFYSFGESYILRPASKKGYHFDGWTNQWNQKVESIEPNMKGNLILTAHYHKEEYVDS